MISRHFLVPWRLSGGRVVNPVLEALETLKDSVRGGAEFRYAPARKQDGLPSRPMCVATVRAEDIREIPVEQLADVVELGAPTAVEQAIRALQPRFAGFRTKPASSRGTFADDFTGTDGQNLGDRTGWTFVAGANADSCQILNNTLTGFRATRSLYTCTDQGADNYTQAKILDAGSHSSSFVATRVVDTANFVGCRVAGTSGTNGLRFSRMNASSVTDMVVTGYVAGTWQRIEADGDDGRWYLGGTGATPSFVQEGTTQDISSVTTTESTQGVTNAGGSAAVEWIDDFEAGALAGGGAASVAVPNANTITVQAQTPTVTANTPASVTVPNSNTVQITLGTPAVTASQQAGITVPNPAVIQLLNGTPAITANAPASVTVPNANSLLLVANAPTITAFNSVTISVPPPAWQKVGQNTFSLTAGIGTEVKNLPSGLRQNDIVIIARASDADLSSSGIVTSGYEERASGVFDNFPGHSVMTKIMGATPDTTVEITRQADFATAGLIQVWRGVDTAMPLDVSAQSAFGSSLMPNPPSLTTVTGRTLRVITGHLDDDAVASSVTAPAGYSNVLASDVVGATVMIASMEDTSVGTNDPAPFGGTGTDDWKTVHMALRLGENRISPVITIGVLSPDILAIAAGERITGVSIGQGMALGEGVRDYRYDVGSKGVMEDSETPD